MARDSRRSIALVVIVAILVAAPAAAFVSSYVLQGAGHSPGAARVTPRAPTIRPEGNGSGGNGSSPAGVILVGDDPDALALDPATGALYVADDSGGTGNGQLSIVNTSTGTAALPISGFADPEGLAFDPLNNYLFVPESTPCCPSYVSVFDTVTDRNVTAIPIGTYNPTADVYDDRNGYVFVSDTNGQAVSVLNGSNDSLVTNIPIPESQNPFGLAYDPSNGFVYVSDGGAGGISVINGSNDTVVDTFPLPDEGEPVSVAYDASNGNLYVGDAVGAGCTSCGGSVEVLNATYGTPITNIPVEAYPRAITVDPLADRVFVTGASTTVGGNGTIGDGNVTVIDDRTDRSIASVRVLHEPSAILVDTADGDVYVADEGSHALSVFPVGLTTYPVTVDESGLQAGTPWNVEVDGATYGSNASSVSFDEPNGTYTVVAESDNGLYLAEPIAPVTVNGSGVTASVVFTGNPDLLVFDETGLPNGTFWAVGVTGGGGNGSATYRNSTTPSIEFVESPGTFTYTVVSLYQYVSTPAAGSVTLTDAPVTVLVTFASAYTVEFNETGLPVGELWNVTLNGSGESSNGPSIEFNEPNGTYSYQIGAPPGYTATGAPAIVRIAGEAVVVLVTFRPFP